MLKWLKKAANAILENDTLNWNRVMKHYGNIDVAGRYIEKKIYLYGYPVGPEKTAALLDIPVEEVSFSWGKNSGQNGFFAALAILLECMTKNEAAEFAERFHEDFINRLPEKDFKETFNLEYWRNGIIQSTRSGTYSERHPGLVDDYE